ncbi:hypothetical protein LPL9_1101 [Lacticaseibacillus paracasei]|nr:hypothetical protein LPL9_1101 [Lacticaseibacillus paracasei]
MSGVTINHFDHGSPDQAKPLLWSLNAGISLALNSSLA